MLSSQDLRWRCIWLEEWTWFFLEDPFNLTSIGKKTKNISFHCTKCTQGSHRQGTEPFSVCQTQKALLALGFFAVLPVRITACLRFAQANLWPLQSFAMALLYITVFTLCVLRGQRCVLSPLSLSVSFNVWSGMRYLHSCSCLRPTCFSKQVSIYYKKNYKELSWRVCVMGCSSEIGMNFK